MGVDLKVDLLDGLVGYGVRLDARVNQPEQLPELMGSGELPDLDVEDMLLCVVQFIFSLHSRLIAAERLANLFPKVISPSR